MDLLLKLRKAYPDRYSEIKKAHDFARDAHAGQKRSSGEDYFIHPCAVVEILADFGFDSSTVIAAFLHDVLEDTPVTADELRDMFGAEILSLVEGVTKLDKLQFNNREEAQAENFRKLFMALARDLRVIIIKLADRLHNMRSLEYLPPEKQQYISKETLDIYAPLAGRLGISFFKCELEDLAMKYLYPAEYEDIVSRTQEIRRQSQVFLEQICNTLTEELKNLGIHGEVNGRPKHYYSILKKIRKANIDIDQVYDLLAVRIITDSVKDCYTLLGLVHNLWKPMPGRFKDYIAMPKANNYQSLHTTVVTGFNETFEIQIRTYEMHKIAEYGIAAHWKYKEGKTSGVESDMESKVRWLREVMDAEKDAGGAREFMDAIRINVFDDEVFVFTPKGDVYDLPVNSTPIDLAYKIHSEVGNHCTGAKVNKKMVTLSTKLQTGDIVELITQQNSRPSLDWLKFVRTSSARSRIRAYFKKEQREENVRRGKDMLERESRRRGYSLSDLLSVSALPGILQRMTMTSEEDLYANVGFGGVTTNQVLTKLVDAYRKEHPIETIEVPVVAEKKVQKHSKTGILIGGDSSFTVRMAHCCSPVPGDEIVGYISRGRGVAIHRKDCPNVAGLGKERLIEASWDNSGAESFSATLHIISEDKSGLLAQITAYIAAAKISITSATIKTDNAQGTAETVISILINNANEVDDLMGRIRNLSGVIEVYR
ncbi:MAG: bifunctional (p)ppGpp synthetase/guanosine-3',5'-bis(diphosphate) 3'-pyrophosphohydrolase [Clostridia bacterium]|nr:bifunctional (p)ppGpp synthetase/guanosine-3',5'-bis(diphosphate) 3'-pyrophosphohydrolase [Clostridia bacterium]